MPLGCLANHEDCEARDRGVCHGRNRVCSGRGSGRRTWAYTATLQSLTDVTEPSEARLRTMPGTILLSVMTAPAWSLMIARHGRTRCSGISGSWTMAQAPETFK